MLELLVACSLVALGSTTWLVYCAPAEPEPEPEHGIQSTTVTLHYQSIPMPIFNALFYSVYANGAAPVTLTKESLAPLAAHLSRKVEGGGTILCRSLPSRDKIARHQYELRSHANLVTITESHRGLMLTFCDDGIDWNGAQITTLGARYRGYHQAIRRLHTIPEEVAIA
mmetsp:Transcript_8509/g.15623  ORF Transcript_8509/g.15623 Transcript_8509/m.15623 type:complete len:169 (+) Transcript_8509:247-753(+)